MRLFLGHVAISLTIMVSAASAEDLLANADGAYGEYLSGECVTCHRADGGDDGAQRTWNERERRRRQNLRFHSLHVCLPHARWRHLQPVQRPQRLGRWRH